MNFFAATASMTSPLAASGDSLALLSERSPEVSFAPSFQYDQGQVWGQGGNQFGDVYVNQETAMNYAAFWAGVTLLSEAMAVPPLKVMRTDKSGTKEYADQHPTNWVTYKAVNEWQTPSNWKSASMCHLLMGGNSVDIIERNGRGQCIGLEKILPTNTRFAVNGETRLPVYMVRRSPVTDSTQIYYQHGFPSTKWETFSHEEILHLRPFSTDGRIGRSVLNQARNSIGMGLTIDRFGKRIFNRGRVQGFISKPGALTDKNREMIRREWVELNEGVDNAFNVGILHSGMDWKQVGYTNDDAQFLQNRAFQILEIARWLRIPPHMLGDLSETSNLSIEQLMLYFIEFTLQPWISRWEEEMNLRLFTPREQFSYTVQFDLDAFLRGDSATRKKNEEMDIRNGVRTIDEVRGSYSLAPYPDGIGNEPLIIASQLDYLKNVFMGKSKLQGGGDKTAPTPAKA